MAIDVTHDLRDPRAAWAPSIYRRDPVAWVVATLFGGRRWKSWLLAALVAAVGAVCLYAIPATNGTLAPRPGFDAAATDINSAIIWLILVPIAAVAYLRQFEQIQEVFISLQSEGVTGFQPEQYRKFVEESLHQFNRFRWTAISLVGFAAPWALFMISVANSPATWYFPPNRWPWFLYCAIQYLEIYAAISYAIRYIITCRRLRALVLGPGLQPQFLHADGLGGFEQIVKFVSRALVVGGGVLIVATLETINTSRTIAHFTQTANLLPFIVIALVYATLVPYLLLYPVRVTLQGIRTAKARLVRTISQRENALIWERVAAIKPDQAPAAHDEHVDVLVRKLTPLGQISTALDTVPDTLFDLSRRSAQVLLLSTTLPPLVAILYRIGSDLWGWNGDNLIKALFGLGH